MKRSLSGSVVVVTGASSGIGRATAHAFARKGAAVVVAARRAHLLDDVAEECRRAGGDALAVPTDTTDADAVERLAAAAVDRFGSIDVWVNNAAVSLFARFHEAPPEDFRRVIETNLFGYVHGARAALQRFREQREGVLINNASIVARVSQPYTSAYVMSKHAVRGLGMSLRQELALAGARGIHVCTVMPATIDTPFFDQAANFTGRKVKPMPPVYPPERAASAIVRLARFPRREVIVGHSGRLLAGQEKLAPGLTERVLAVMTDRTHLYRDRPADPTHGNLFEPQTDGSVDGGWNGARKTRVRRLLTAGIALGGLAVLRNSRS